ncbi:hypothetical protein QNM97_20735 [Gordonia sp. L191]|uniref:hypothetical protein n=1 Tax=Gordonia sp. L191 TaxID=2982699 RepID=UPI0024C0E20A|nr:hypothetical protein [Gordonia sp. L191]WHU46392.1 hypothetical protein QNM97_20735 [Gordonia sp. L191]
MAIARLQKSVDNYFLLIDRALNFIDRALHCVEWVMDVVAMLVISPGLEARRTRLAPRPSGGRGERRMAEPLDHRSKKTE